MYIFSHVHTRLRNGLAGLALMAGASVGCPSEEQGAVAGLVRRLSTTLVFTVGPLLGTYLLFVDGALPYWFCLCGVNFFFVLFTFR